MATKEGFTIEISSRYEGWWRYNVALMCGCFDTAGNRTGFASTEAHVADVGSNLREKPAGNPGGGRASLETGPCDHLLLYIYICLLYTSTRACSTMRNPYLRQRWLPGC